MDKILENVINLVIIVFRYRNFLLMEEIRNENTGNKLRKFFA